MIMLNRTSTHGRYIACIKHTCSLCVYKHCSLEVNALATNNTPSLSSQSSDSSDMESDTRY